MLLADNVIVHADIPPGRFDACVCHYSLQCKQISAIHQELPAEETAKAVRRNDLTWNTGLLGIKFETFAEMVGFQRFPVIR